MDEGSGSRDISSDACFAFPPVRRDSGPTINSVDPGLPHKTKPFLVNATPARRLEGRAVQANAFSSARYLQDEERQLI